MALIVASRFQQIKSPANSGCGIFVNNGHSAIRVVRLTYSYLDTAVNYNPNTMILQGRIAIIRGQYPADPALFVPTTDLTAVGADVLLDMDLSGPGPAIFVIPPHDSPDAIRSREGDGLSILLSSAIITGGAGNQMVGKLNGGSEPISAQEALGNFGRIS